MHAGRVGGTHSSANHMLNGYRIDLLLIAESGDYDQPIDAKQLPRNAELMLERRSHEQPKQ